MIAYHRLGHGSVDPEPAMKMFFLVASVSWFTAEPTSGSKLQLPHWQKGLADQKGFGALLLGGEAFLPERCYFVTRSRLYLSVVNLRPALARAPPYLDE